MPSNFSAVESAFPNLNGMSSTEQKLRAIQDYLYLLLEQLRYTLENLGAENFNETSLQEITGPIYKTITDAEKGLQTSLEVTAEGIRTEVRNSLGDITELSQTATDFTTAVNDRLGNFSQGNQNATGFAATVENKLGNFTQLSQTATSITQAVQDKLGGYAILTSTATEIQSTVDDYLTGSYSSNSQTAQGLISEVADLSNHKSSLLKLTADGLYLYDGSSPLSAKIKFDSQTGSITLTGAITWDDLSAGVQTTINGKLSSYTEQETIAKQIAAGTYSSGTFINGTEIYGPKIYSNSFQILPQTMDGESTQGGVRYWGYLDDAHGLYQLFEVLRIEYLGVTGNANRGPAVRFSSPCGGDIQFKGSSAGNPIRFIDNVDFSEAAVTGLTNNVYFSFS